jgi:translation initiation factor 3 subunit A
VQQPQAALSLLHEHVINKRTRNSPIASLEPVMILFVELCVDLRKGKLAKDGLYQYKNTAQNTNVGTIEVCKKEYGVRGSANVWTARVQEVHRTG